MENKNELLRMLPEFNQKDKREANSFHPQTGMDVKYAGMDKNTPTPAGDSDSSSSDVESHSHRAVSDSTFHAFSGLYAQIVVVISAILVFTEVIKSPIPLLSVHGYLFSYLVGGAILCFLIVYASILAEKCPRIRNTEYDAEKQISTPFMRNLLSSNISIYLRMGAVVFGLGTLISTGLETASMFTMPHDCKIRELDLAQPILRGIFAFLQMHFLFMNVKDILQALGRFRHVALMHLVATNVAIWMQLVLWGSATDWLDAVHPKHNASEVFPPKEFNFTLHTLESDMKSSDPLKHKPYHKVYFTTNCWWRPPQEDDTEDLIRLHICLQNSTIGAIWEKALPYLYPFIIQYSLVAASVIYIIWTNLQKRHKKFHLTKASVYGRDSTKDQMNCAGSTKGLFLGLLVLVSGIIALILFFVLPDEAENNETEANKQKQKTALFVISTLRCSVLGISALAAVLGLFQIKKMKSKTSRQMRLSELLQRTGMLAVYVYGICTMIAGGTNMNTSYHILLFSDGILMVIQACIQSLLIHQVTKKRLGPSNEGDKPGRQVVIFLVFINAVLWLFESFTTQHYLSSILQRKFYGEVVWSLANRIVLPMVIFYRFHSAVALMEAWHKSYKIKTN